MAKGTRYTPEFRAKAVRLLAESRSSYSSETNAISAVAKDPGIAPESLRRWRNQSDATVAEETRQSAEDAMAELKKLRAENAQLRRANEILTTASAFFFRGQARPGTALMAAYIDEYRSRFRVGPICRVLPESLDCGFLTPRGYRMFRTRPVSRMRARREALARDILQIHSDFFMAVYGYGKMHAQLVAQGWDPAGVGRDRVMNIMRGLGIRGVRRGRTPVTTKPAKGTGGRPDLVDGRFEACAPNRLHVAGVTYVRMANGSFGCTAFADGVYARRIVGWACAMTMNTQELPLQALGQAISWAASRGGADGLIRHGDHGTQCTGTVYATGVMEYGMLPSTGTVGDSCDNAMDESADGAYRTELVWRRRPFADLKDLELATFRWVSWWNSKRLHRSLGYRTPEAVETEYYQHQAAQAAPL